MNKIKLSELMVLLPILLLVAWAAPDARAQSEAPICESLVQDSTTLTVTYSKTELTCAHLRDNQLQITHVQNFFCAVGVSVAITQPLTSFGASVGKAELIDPLRLCNGNNLNACTPCGPIQEADQDSDNDGVFDSVDLCPGTVLPEATIPTVAHGIKRNIDTDGDGILEIVHPKSKEVVDGEWTLDDTGGCTCEQILATCGTYGSGHTKFGCSSSVIDTWVNLLGAGLEGRCE